MKLGVQLNVAVAGSKLAPLGRPLAVYTGVSPSGSLAATVKVSRLPSLPLLLPIAASTGARFVFAIVIAIVSLAVSVPSLAVKVAEYGPAWVKLGVQLNVAVA